ncbi:MAG: UDP-N-acetylmuramoyl-L-alanyl-D-glutamate--2,6-diaminopimelate ligase [Bacillota bacterium]
MKIRDLLDGLDDFQLMGDPEIEVGGLCHDSRRAEPGDVFFSLAGKRTDGHHFIQEALIRGARVLVVSRFMNLAPGTAYLYTGDVRKAMSVISRNYYGRPDQRLVMLGVTGTNGKTTTGTCAAHLLQSAGAGPGLVSTVENWIGGSRVPAEHTTPEAPEFFRLLREMVENHNKYAVIEVSSHGLALKRLYGCRFAKSLFTNLSHEHFDFHGGFPQYLDAKRKLFFLSDLGILNRDDRFFNDLSAGLAIPFATYGLEGEADYRAVRVEFGDRFFTADFVFKGQPAQVRVPLLGTHNVYNALAAAALVREAGMPVRDIVRGLASFRGVAGRMEVIEEGQPFCVMVDYAHTPDGLAKLLKTLRAMTGGRIILIFGCRGERDPYKRPRMGEIAAADTDLCWITNDSPYGEDPGQIIRAVEEGFRAVKKTGCFIQPDRRGAFKEAVASARRGDIVVAAGRGHEQYIYQGDQIISFDDREVFREILRGYDGGRMESRTAGS